MRTGSRRHRISTVFQIPGRRADSLRIGLYTNFLDTTMAAAVVDRLVYTGRLVKFNGASYRMENALMLGKGEAE